MSSSRRVLERLYCPSSVRNTKNKQLRQAWYHKERLRRAKEKRERRKQRRKERENLGDEAPSKEVPKTLENTRLPEETVVLPDDDEILQDEKTDEMATYFGRKITPKVLLTSFTRASHKTHVFLKELADCVPNSEVRWRRGTRIKSIIQEAIKRDYTSLIVVEEHAKIPNGAWLIHLPEGPTAYFKLTSFKPGKLIKGHGRVTSHKPEVILNSFTTRLGHTVGRMLAALFPQDPQFRGRRVVTFHNQRDFIFFRHHRYIFKNAQRVGLQELGPRFTLKLRSLQKGTFDSMFGEYVWVHKRKQMDTSRRRFHL